MSDSTETRLAAIEAKLDSLMALVAPVESALEAGARMIPEAPGFAAMAVDVVDEYANGLQEDGVDINALMSNATRSALRIGAALGEREMEALDVLLSSQALSPEAARLVAAAAAAVVDSARREVKPLGLLGLLKALRDEEVGRALALAVDVARRTGATLGTSGVPAQTSRGIA